MRPRGTTHDYFLAMTSFFPSFLLPRLVTRTVSQCVSSLSPLCAVSATRAMQLARRVGGSKAPEAHATHASRRQHRREGTTKNRRGRVAEHGATHSTRTTIASRNVRLRRRRAASAVPRRSSSSRSSRPLRLRCPPRGPGAARRGHRHRCRHLPQASHADARGGRIPCNPGKLSRSVTHTRQRSRQPGHTH